MDTKAPRDTKAWKLTLDEHLEFFFVECSPTSSKSPLANFVRKST